MDPERNLIQKDTCTPVSTAVYSQQDMEAAYMPITEEQIKKIWYPHTTECHSAIERNETGSFAETWMDLKSVIQSEVSQKNKYPMLMHARGIQKMIWMSLFGGQRQTHRHRKWTYGHCSRGKGVL